MDQAEQAKEDAAAARLEKFMADYLKKHPEEEGVHYSDLFEQYLPVTRQAQATAGRLAPGILLQDADGTWRLPDNEKKREQTGRPA